jgi:selenocysteine lyase/cysteine desulfurase
LPERRQHQRSHFCRGATEGLNLVTRGFQHDRLKLGDEVLETEAEHYSNIVPW